MWRKIYTDQKIMARSPGSRNLKKLLQRKMDQRGNMPQPRMFVFAVAGFDLHIVPDLVQFNPVQIIDVADFVAGPCCH